MNHILHWLALKRLINCNFILYQLISIYTVQVPLKSNGVSTVRFLLEGFHRKVSSGTSGASPLCGRPLAERRSIQISSLYQFGQVTRRYLVLKPLTEPVQIPVQSSRSGTDETDNLSHNRRLLCSDIRMSFLILRPFALNKASSNLWQTEVRISRLRCQESFWRNDRRVFGEIRRRFTLGLKSDIGLFSEQKSLRILLGFLLGFIRLQAIVRAPTRSILRFSLF